MTFADLVGVLRGIPSITLLAQSPSPAPQPIGVSWFSHLDYTLIFTIIAVVVAILVYVLGRQAQLRDQRAAESAKEQRAQQAFITAATRSLWVLDAGIKLDTPWSGADDVEREIGKLSDAAEAVNAFRNVGLPIVSAQELLRLGLAALRSARSDPDTTVSPWKDRTESAWFEQVDGVMAWQLRLGEVNRARRSGQISIGLYWHVIYAAIGIGVQAIAAELGTLDIVLQQTEVEHIVAAGEILIQGTGPITLLARPQPLLGHFFRLQDQFERLPPDDPTRASVWRDMLSAEREYESAQMDASHYTKSNRERAGDTDGATFASNTIDRAKRRIRQIDEDLANGWPPIEEVIRCCQVKQREALFAYARQEKVVKETAPDSNGYSQATHALRRLELAYSESAIELNAHLIRLAGRDGDNAELDRLREGLRRLDVRVQEIRNELTT